MEYTILNDSVFNSVMLNVMIKLWYLIGNSI